MRLKEDEMKSSSHMAVFLSDKKLLMIERIYCGQFLLIKMWERHSLMTEGKVDFTSKKRAETVLFSRHLFFIQEHKNKFASVVLLPALPPKCPGARALFVTAQKVILLVIINSNILLRQLRRAIGL